MYINVFYAKFKMSVIILIVHNASISVMFMRGWVGENKQGI